MERVHSGIGYMGKKREFKECARSNRRIRKRVLTGYGRCSATRARRRDVPMRRTTKEVYGKKLYGWSDKQYNQEYRGRLERNWRRWKGKKPVRRGMMKTIPEEEEIEEEKSEVREWTEEDDNEMGNMVDPYYKL